jgi:hypothetical protein
MAESTFPDIFDKARLKSDEFKRYIYEIPFKTKGGGVRIAKGMTAAGHIRAIHPYLKSVQSEMLHYGTVGARNIMCCVIRVTVVISVDDEEYTVQALADGDVTGVPSADTLVRTVETRALNRCLGRLLDLSNADLNAPDGDPSEEEAGTPMYQPSSFSEKMQAKKDKEAAERQRLAEEEGDDDDNQTDARRLPDRKDSPTTSGSDSDDEDW